MPFSTERTELIKVRIKERLNSGLANDWELSFLNNMEVLFNRYGSKTRLSDAQYGKLKKLLKLRNINPKPQPVSVNSQSDGVPTRHIPKTQPRSARSSSSQWKKPRARLRSPIRIAKSPMRAARRLERKLILPVLMVMGFLALIGSALDPTTSVPTTPSQQSDNATYVFVTGSRVNQRDGPSTAHHVMGQLTEGTRVRKVRDQGGWSQIVSTLGTGWMSSNFLSPRGAALTERATNRSINPIPSSSLQNGRTVQARDIRVIDGDTVAINGQRANVRLVGFNTPETWSPSCPAELEIGRRATARLKTLIREARSIEFRRVACACRPGTEGTSQCNFGRQCGSLIVDGTDVGNTLIRERLAVRYRCGTTSCPPRPGNWCR